ncbi:YdaS family helix-turn-helix protein [Parendozoicomonas sp. Alg238-R29]|uniref:YdaS family helix-turn-helix protein n=1 Tax=Parendozoicomonas sp. Alg238-R29 TaxID=2993446 RepID=UPI00248E964C|nr:YdaS family helix-turn-helix protein [Parendozoicomonas sp. Alg238-R29]
MNSYEKLKGIYRSQAGIAEALNISQPSVWEWGGVIPARHAKTVSDLTGGEITIAEVHEDYEQARPK